MQMLTEAAGFGTIVIGTFLLHATKDLDVSAGQVSQLLAAPGRESGHAYTELPVQARFCRLAGASARLMQGVSGTQPV